MTMKTLSSKMYKLNADLESYRCSQTFNGDSINMRTKIKKNQFITFVMNTMEI